MSQQKNSTKLQQKICKWCGKEYTGHFNRNYCSDRCQKDDYNARVFEKRKQKNLEKYPDGCDPDSYVVCALCGLRSGDLGRHIITSHEMSTDEYKEKYGPVKSKHICDSVKGDKNPAYNHGGKFSPFSKKFIKYENVENVDEVISNLGIKAQQTAKENDNLSNTIAYYLKRGKTLDEAEELVRTSRTFTLEKCIAKYGEEEGRRIWQERQDKWQATLKSKSQEEIDDINKRKSTKVNYKTLFGLNIDADGWIYLLKLDDTKVKVGITTKDRITKRYTDKDLKNVEVLLFEQTEDVNHAFMIEQHIKEQYREQIIDGKYGVFGWTEVIHNPAIDIITSRINQLLQDKELAHKAFRHEAF